ncbi:MAG: hypothetical protein H7Z72_18535 [Bacteroidetes bacterium]|nr:hypothetical protein [Fibrella sp.]
MEYRIETTGYLSDEDVLKAVKRFLNPASGGSPGFYSHTGPIDVPLPDRDPGFDTARTDSQRTIGVNGLPRPGIHKPDPAAGSLNRFGYASAGSVQIPTVRLVPLSGWGGTTQYYFWRDNNRLLQTDRRATHPQWNHMMGSWHRPIVVQAAVFQPVAISTGRAGGSGKPVSQMSDTEKLTEAMLRALPRIPDHLKAAVEELLTPANIALFVGITVVLMASGVGEVLGLGLLAVGFVAGGLDLFINVLRMVFDFYRQATRATTERELDQAADLFVEIILRGGVDILDILVGRRAAARLAGRGLRSVGAYLNYLEEEMKLWRARQGSSGQTRRGATAVEEAAPPPQPTPVKPKKPTRITASDELKDIKLAGRSRADIETNLRNEGYTSVPARSGGTVWTKPMPDGNTAIVRIDPPTVRTPPRGYADEVAHAHKEVVPTAEVKAGDYNSKVTRPIILDESGMPNTSRRDTHIPIIW